MRLGVNLKRVNLEYVFRLIDSVKYFYYYIFLVRCLVDLGLVYEI